MNESIINPENLQLKDIHLPEAVSWWPPAAGWWLLLVTVLLLLMLIFIGRKIYLKRQLRRDIRNELQHIRQQFERTGDKLQLASSLSILLRRASITFYPEKNLAGLTGENWLSCLDETSHRKKRKLKFDSETGRVLLVAPYLPAETDLDFDAQQLLQLCQSWLLAAHRRKHRVTAA